MLIAAKSLDNPTEMGGIRLGLVIKIESDYLEKIKQYVRFVGLLLSLVQY